MDEILSVGTALSLVGLIATYQQLRDARKSGEAQDFQAFLIEHGFAEIASKIEESRELQASMSSLLREDNAAIASKLQVIDDVVRSIAQRIEGFASLAASAPNEEYLSGQACDFLAGLDACPTGKVLVHSNGPYLFIAFFGAGDFKPPEPRFFADDLAKLAAAGWIRLVEHNNQGQPIYSITRRGSQAVKRFDTPD